jgi:glycosyltransferase involved in cell wall biosynthesis
MKRILHLITGLGLGGAETILASLITNAEMSSFSHGVVALLDEGHFGPILRSRSVSVECLNLSRVRVDPSSIIRLRREILAFEPDLIHCWMYHPALMHGVVSLTIPHVPVVWGLHHTNVSNTAVSRRTRAVIKATRFIAQSVPARIVCCSESTREHHEEIGYPKSKLQVIVNGVDWRYFQRAAEAGSEMRMKLGIPEDALVIGHVGRYDPQKDHACLVRACGLVRKHVANVRFVFCGLGVDWENDSLVREVKAAGIQDLVLLLGLRTDVADILGTFDLFALSSAYGEALPIALLEAMSAGAISLATDVGDCARTIGDPQRIVPVRRPDLLADAMVRVTRAAESDLARMRREASERVRQMYSVETMSRSYRELYEQLLGLTGEYRAGSDGIPVSGAVHQMYPSQ